jgi:hypothetical protein
VSVDGRPADAGPRLRTYYTLEEVEAVARAAGPTGRRPGHPRPAGRHRRAVVLCLGHIRSGAAAVAAVELGPDGRLTVLGRGSGAA